MRELMDDLALQGGLRLNVQVACSSYLRAAQLVESGICAAALPDLAKESLGPDPHHWLPIPYRSIPIIGFRFPTAIRFAWHGAPARRGRVPP